MKQLNTAFILCCLLFVGCHMPSNTPEKKIGLSQCMLDDAWRQAMLRDMQIELSNYDKVELIVRDANSSNENQIRQIEELIALGVDVLIISPFESEPITAVAEKAYDAGIPTIITDRRIHSDKYTTFIGGDNYQIGLEAGEYARKLLPKGKACILEIWGLPSSSPAQERHAGFVKALTDNGASFTMDKIDGDWRYDTTQVRMQRIADCGRYDLVYSHNDMMAIAAREFFDKKDTLRIGKVSVLGVDAVPEAGLEAVADGRINASFLYPTGGTEVVRTAMQLIDGFSVPKEISLQTMPMEQRAAQTLSMQTQRMIDYQKNIIQKKEKIDQLTDRFSFLKNSLSTFIILFLVLIVLLTVIFRINKKLKKRNSELYEKNLREEEQSRKLVALNAEIEQATAQKLQFFTNISHEIRTPLTLILSPLDKLIGTEENPAARQELQLVQRNANRLLREVNQMLDFRKMENRKQDVHLKAVLVVPFVQDVKCYFDGIAREHNIHYTVSVKDNCIPTLSLDPDLMEKVLVNLLSNAFKYTPNGGYISINIAEGEQDVQIAVVNTGVGISAEDLPFVFERFYSKSETKISSTGIGLHLVKEYVTLHNGQISVSSTAGEKTVFSISLPKIHGVLNDRIAATDERSYGMSDADEAEIGALLNQKYDYTILLVEDDEEIRQYLQRELSDCFRVLTAENGKTALEVLDKNDVSLIVSDVMMPEMNGFELCGNVKNDINYSHILFILLTALSSERQRMFGTATGADDYIPKPFSVGFVKIKIIRLLESKKRIREELLRKIQESGAFKSNDVPVESIEDLFLRKLLKQVDAVYTDSEYNVERLSDAMAMSRGHFYRKVKELTGVSPVDFLRNYRLKQAVDLLRQKHFSISEIAYDTGFSSPAYFSKCFKAVYGVTPSDFA